MENKINIYYERIKKTIKRSPRQKTLNIHDFEDEGIKCGMKYGYFYFWAEDILGPNNIDLTKIF